MAMGFRAARSAVGQNDRVAFVDQGVALGWCFQHALRFVPGDLIEHVFDVEPLGVRASCRAYGGCEDREKRDCASPEGQELLHTEVRQYYRWSSLGINQTESA
jgi:hypothetical protein